MKKRMKSRLSTLLTILCLVILLFAVVLIVRNARGEVTFLFGRSLFRVRTASMEPGIEAGSYILVARVRTDQIAVGDIITFRSDDPAIRGQLNTHRVTEILDGGTAFRTKGDNNPGEDLYPVPADHVVARYVRPLPGLTAIGRAVFARNIFPIILIVLSAAVFVCAVIELVRKLQIGKRGGAAGEAAHEAEIERRVQEEVERLKKADAARGTGETETPDPDTSHSMYKKQ